MKSTVTEPKAEMRDESCLAAEFNQAARKIEKGLHETRQAAEATLEDAKFEARRLAKRSRYRAEDYVSDAVQQVRRKPLSALFFAFAAGAAMVLLFPRAQKT